MLWVAACAIALTSCKKNDNGGPGGDAAPGTIKATIDGKAFTSLKMTTKATRVNAGGKPMITLQGNDASGKALIFTILGVETTGTYNIGGGANISIGLGYTEINISNPTDTKTWQAPFDSSIAGEIQISELTDKAIKGTFKAKAKGNTSSNTSTVDITNGAFNMNF